MISTRSKNLVSEKEKRLNILYFVGFVDEILEPRQVIGRNNRVHLVRMVVVKEKPKYGLEPYAIALQLPDTFLVSKIHYLKRMNVLTQFGFYVKVAKSATGSVYINMLNCVSIMPVVQTLEMKRYNQILKIQKKSDYKTEHPKVDKDGYKLPYNY